MDDVQTLLERIRKNVVAEAEQKFADETFQHLRFSLRKGRMQDADATACVTKSGGEMMEIYLKFENNRVRTATYLTDGDNAASMCGSCVTEMAIGKTVREMMNLRPCDVIKRIGRNGSGLEQCALLAIEGLHKALENYSSARGGKYHGTGEKEQATVYRSGTQCQSFAIPALVGHEQTTHTGQTCSLPRFLPKGVKRGFSFVFLLHCHLGRIWAVRHNQSQVIACFPTEGCFLPASP